ncbi:hypothetical protein [Ferruginibacter sp.]|uniref:hypothetical protein n=1 Tax=Ferruginibacter sp. TaxID=1940288 RepID=UPI00265A07C2|nr:hypothetical protein [Ferruginibacter sp.]
MKNTIFIAMCTSIVLAACGNQTSDNHSNAVNSSGMETDTVQKGKTSIGTGNPGVRNDGNTASGTSNATGNDTSAIGTNRSVTKDSINMKDTGRNKLSNLKPKKY